MLGLPYADDDDMLSCVDACRFGLAVTRWSRTAYSYSTPGPVSAWMGDRLWTDKPPRRRTRHPGLYSAWAIPPWVGAMSTQRKLRKWKVHRVIH